MAILSRKERELEGVKSGGERRGERRGGEGREEEEREGIKGERGRGGPEALLRYVAHLCSTGELMAQPEGKLG